MNLDELCRIWPVLGPADALHTAEAGAGLRIVGDNGVFHLRTRASDQALEREFAVINHLHRAGFAVALPLAPGTEAEAGNFKGKPAFLYRELPGEPYNDFDGERGPGRARRLGEVLGSLHLCFANFAAGDTFPDVLAPDDLVDRIIAAGDVSDTRRMQAIVAHLSDFGDLPRQLIHRDYHAGNVLFDEDRLSGLIDLDHLMIGPRIFDLCYCMLGGSLLAIVGSAHWLECLKALVAGYEAHIHLTAAERSAIPDMMIEIELIFMRWYRRIGEPASNPEIERLIYRLDGARDEIAGVVGVR